ncbi:hypothetical protein FQA39_LY15807 [Lamprigera yunnana]|nr:hypothetical protein FQA39_LY15807 [Lamprigera yunnana]
MNEESVVKVKHSIPLDILSDLITRFLIFVPPESKQNLIRICFQIELAHWYYLDFYVANDSSLKGCSITEFATHVFQHIPSLQQYCDKITEIMDEWKMYKQSVPTYGAILLSADLTHVVLVQSYFSKSSWGFPKGKVNQEEDPTHCAIREVLEETGFDITNYIDPNLYLEAIIHEQLVRLYVIMGISMDTKFQPKTRNEIKACEWFAIADLPNNKKDVTPKCKIGVNRNAFFMVLPFIKRIKALSQSNTKPKRNRQKSISISEGESSMKTKSKNNQKPDTDDIKFIIKIKEKRPSHSKRQLFHTQEPIEFSAPSWLNFKFDKSAIMECIP